MHLIIDTSVLIDFLRGGDTAAAFTEAFDNAVISAVTAMELFEGAHRSRGDDRRVIERLIDRVRVVDFTPSVARRAAQLRVDQYEGGRPVSVAGSIIAASALETDQPVLTKDLDGFSGVDDFNAVAYAAE